MTVPRVHSLVITLMVGAVLALILALPDRSMSQGVPGALVGFGWSDTIGWVSFDCGSAGTCASHPYGMAIAEDGTVSGYAWSDSVGWISAEPADLVGCPSAPCAASISGTALTGWMRALSSSHAESGGWDGYIALGDTDTTDGIPYGIGFDEGDFSGYAWGSRIIGWLDFSLVSTDYRVCAVPQGYSCNGSFSEYTDAMCVVSSQDCSLIGEAWTCGPAGICISVARPTGTLTILPTLVRSGTAAQVSWSAEDTDSCTVTGNGDTFSGGATGNETTSPVTNTVTYVLTCIDAAGEPVVIASAQVGIIPSWREI